MTEYKPPDKWIVAPITGGKPIVTCAGYVIATMGSTGERGRKHAAIIKAAPGLLAAAEHASMSEHHPACDHTHPKRCTCHVEKCRAAVASAAA